jgi:hypothetical protein
MGHVISSAWRHCDDEVDRRKLLRRHAQSQIAVFDSGVCLTTIMVMVRPAPFSIVYDRDVKSHLRTIDARHHSLIRRSIETHLLSQPDTETRNRKPLSRSAELEADWELRFGPDNRFRVFYTVDRNVREVQILAIGVKRGNRLFIGGEEIKL